jgi:anaerobic magnesium-protoporphyrin IX monomethyl ester cyclase
MKVALIQPCATDHGYIHLGLASIAACLQEDGHQVRIIDLGIDGTAPKKIAGRIRGFDPDVVGISSLTPTYPVALNTAAIVKQVKPECLTVLGGSHPSVLTDEVVVEPNVDIIVRGEGEVTMVELLRALQEERDLGGVAGISYKSDGKPIHNPDRPFIDDMEMLPPIPWHLFELEKYTGSLNGKKAVGISSSRGCPFNCIFCYRGPAAGKRVRSWSPERTFKEIDRVATRYAVYGFHFWNELFTFDKDWVLRFCDLLIDHGMKLQWDCQTRADLLSDDILGKMKQAGCVGISVGVESGSEDVLRQTEKKVDKKRVRDAFSMIRASGIESTATFTLGLPWDTGKSIQETVDFAKTLSTDYSMFYVATPFPGSRLWTLCQEKGTKLSRNWTNYRIVPFQIDLDNVVSAIDPSKLSIEELRRCLRTAQIQFQISKLRGRGTRARGFKYFIRIPLQVLQRTRSIRELAKLFLRVLKDTGNYLLTRTFGKSTDRQDDSSPHDVS